MNLFTGETKRKTGCSRCGNPRFKPDPSNPFPYCDECEICADCGGAKIFEGKPCKKCYGRGYVVKNVKTWGPSVGGGYDYDEESDEFFSDDVLLDEDIELISLEDLADEEFAEFDEIEDDYFDDDFDDDDDSYDELSV